MDNKYFSCGILPKTFGKHDRLFIGDGQVVTLFATRHLNTHCVGYLICRPSICSFYIDNKACTVAERVRRLARDQAHLSRQRNHNAVPLGIQKTVASVIVLQEKCTGSRWDAI